MSATVSKTDTTNPSIANYYKVISLSKKSQFLGEGTGIILSQLTSNIIENLTSTAFLKRNKGNS